MQHKRIFYSCLASILPAKEDFLKKIKNEKPEAIQADLVRWKATIERDLIQARKEQFPVFLSWLQETENKEIKETARQISKLLRAT
jgi:hypothetical protein